MKDLPAPIERDNFRVADIDDFIWKFNELLEIVAEMRGERWDGWDWVLINPEALRPPKKERGYE